MIELLAIPLFAIARRVQGGWLGMPRFVSVGAYAAFCMALFNTQPIAVLLAFGATCAMMLPPHIYDPDVGLSKRYLGPVFGGGYILAKSYVNKHPGSTLCWSCIGEAYLGGAVAIALIGGKHALVNFL